MADPLFDKIWNMDPGVSLFSTTKFKPNKETRLYETRQNGYKLTVSGEHNGQPYQWEYEAYYDGKIYPVTGRPDVSGITIFKLNDKQTCGFFVKPNNMPGGPYSRKLSDDEKVLTVETAGLNMDGSPFYDVIQYTV